VNHTRAAHRRLERLAFRARPSLETIEFDGWILRFADGYTKRANSVNPHFGSTLPVSEKIAQCEALYAERELPTIFRLTPFSQPEALDRQLAGVGYRLLDRSLVLTCRPMQRPAPGPGSVRHVPRDEWLATFDRLHRLEPTDRAVHRRIVETAEGSSCFAQIDEDGESVSCGLGVLVEDAVGLFDLFTAPDRRRCGHGGTVVASIVRWACRHGARTAYLQTHSRNNPALRLYERLGFALAYPYWYRMAEP